MDEELLKKLALMGMHLGVSSQPISPRKRSSTHRIESVIPEGAFISTEHGSVFHVLHTYASSYIHGYVHTTPFINSKWIWHWANINPPESPDRIIFLDTETSSLSPGAGTLVFLVGIGCWSEEQFCVSQYFLDDPGSEVPFLAYLGAIIEQATLIVTFNGRSFDLPVLANRFIVNGLSNPFVGKNHLDLLHLARHLWRFTLPSRRLGFLEAEILGFQRGEDETPSWMVPEIYLNYLHKRDARPLKGVLYHNEMDIVSLAALLNYIALLFENPVRVAHQPEVLLSVADVYAKVNPEAAIHWLCEASKTPNLNPKQKEAIWLRLADLNRKVGRFEEALKCWEQAAAEHSVEACIALAKYYEYRAKRHHDALRWTERAIELLDTFVLSPLEKRRYLELAKRRQRLLTKIGW